MTRDTMDIINAVIPMLYDNDNDAVNIMLLQLEQNDAEIAKCISKSWLYRLVADIIGTTERTAYNKLSGFTPFTIDDVVKLKRYFNTNVTFEQIIYYLDVLKGKMTNER